MVGGVLDPTGVGRFGVRGRSEGSIVIESLPSSAMADRARAVQALLGIVQFTAPSTGLHNSGSEVVIEQDRRTGPSILTWFKSVAFVRGAMFVPSLPYSGCLFG